MTMLPPELLCTRPFHSDLVLSAHAALESALEATELPADSGLEVRYRSTVGVNANLAFHNEVCRRLGEQVRLIEEKGFVALVLEGTTVALRLGRCSSTGLPNDKDERPPGTPFGDFKRGTPLLFNDAALTPVFLGYSLARPASDAEGATVIVDRVILSRFEGQEQKWAWALDTPGHDSIRSAVEHSAGSRGSEVLVEPVEILIERQARFAS